MYVLCNKEKYNDVNNYIRFIIIQVNKNENENIRMPRAINLACSLGEIGCILLPRPFHNPMPFGKIGGRRRKEGKSIEQRTEGC